MAADSLRAVQHFETFAKLRANQLFSGIGALAYIEGSVATLDGGQGFFAPDLFDLTTPDNGAAVIVDAGGRRWKRISSLASEAGPPTATSLYPENFGAKGDGVRGTRGVATATDATFTDAFANWTSADIGKAIVVQGAGAAGAAHATTIASINSPTSIELTLAAVTTVASNAVYVYGTDDTAAFAAAMARIEIGSAIELKSGAIYCVTNIVLSEPINPLVVWSVTHKANSIFCADGKAEISIVGGGDGSYGVATARWLAANPNKAFTGQPWEFRNIHFDGNMICDVAIVVKSFRTRFFDCDFLRGRVDDCRLTRQNQDGTDGAGSGFNSECGWWRCHWNSRGSRAGLYSEGTVSQPDQASTDGRIIDCSFSGIDGTTPTGVLLGNTGGWHIRGNHTYSYDQFDLDILSLSRIGSFSNNIFEDAVRIRLSVDVSSADPIRIGGDNNYWTGLTVEYANNSNAQTLIVADDNFTFRFANAQITMTTDFDEKVLIVENCNFIHATPVAQTNAGTLVFDDVFAGGGFAPDRTIGGATHFRAEIGEADVIRSLRRYSSDGLPARYELTKARGTFASPANVVQFDQLGDIFYFAWADGAFRSAANIRGTVRTATPSSTDMESSIDFFCSPAGSVTPASVVEIRHAQGISMYNGNVVIDQNRHHALRSYTVATLPSAATAQRMIYVSDGVNSKRLAISDGSVWRFADGTQVSTTVALFLASGGSAGAPAFSFFGDPNTGMFSDGADILRFATNGTTRLTISTGAITCALVVQAPDQSAATPSFSFNLDANTGIYRIGDDIGGLAANGAEAARWGTFGLQTIAGSAGAPSFSFTGDPNTGFYSGGADQIGVSANGAVRATFTATALNLASGVALQVNGTQVVTAQGAAVADAAGGATVDAEARTAINTLLARVRAGTGHGLIAA